MTQSTFHGVRLCLFIGFLVRLDSIGLAYDANTSAGVREVSACNPQFNVGSVHGDFTTIRLVDHQLATAYHLVAPSSIAENAIRLVHGKLATDVRQLLPTTPRRCLIWVMSKG